MGFFAASLWWRSNEIIVYSLEETGVQEIASAGGYETEFHRGPELKSRNQRDWSRRGGGGVQQLDHRELSNCKKLLDF